MAKSEKAKALEAQQKAAIKAAKLAKKNSTNPADWGRLRQYRHLYTTTAEVDPRLNLWMALAALGAAAIAVVMGVLLNWWPAVTVVFALVLAVMAALIVVLQRAKGGIIKRYEGQAGSAEVALSMLNSKKYTHQPAVAFNRDLDMVHRVIGPCGVVLVGEGKNAARVRTLLGQEQKRHQQVLYGVPVTTLVMGDGTGQVKLADLQKAIEKLPKAIQPAQQTAIQAKLKSLDAVRPKAPLPKGPMPTMKGVNRSMRGR